jgi:predicted Fe-Mo cluster-binding NifX family protein
MTNAASERLEAHIREAIPAIERISLHLEPRRREVLRVAVPLVSPFGEIDGDFGGAPYFAVADVRAVDGEVLRREILANPRLGTEKQKGILVAEWLVGQDVDVLITVRDINKGPSYVLREAGVEMRRARTTKLDDELRLLRPESP